MANKILLIHHRLPANVPMGAESIVAARIKILREEGRLAGLLTTRRFSRLSDLFISSDAADHKDYPVFSFFPANFGSFDRLSAYGFLRRLAFLLGTIFSLHSFFIVRRFLQNLRPSLVEVHGFYGIGFLVVAAAKAARIPTKLVMHDVCLVMPSGVLPWNHHKDSLFVRAYVKLAKMIVRPEMVIFPSGVLKDFYEKRGFFANINRVVEKNPETVRFLSAEVRPADYPPNKFLYVGQVSSHKGIKTLISAWAAWPHLSGKKLEVVGFGALVKYVKLAAERDSSIVYVGAKFGDELARAYENTDAVIFSSECFENSPTVLSEARFFGRLIVSVDTPSAREALQGYDKVLWYTPGSVVSLQKVFLDLASKQKA